MEKKAILLVLVILVSSFGISCTRDSAVNALAIRDIQTDPLSFTGELTINGVVAAFSQNDTAVFGIMDTAELIACKNLQCGAFILPVRYVGGDTAPELADEINVTGSWVETEDGLFIFEATRIDSKRNIMSILTS